MQAWCRSVLTVQKLLTGSVFIYIYIYIILYYSSIYSIYLVLLFLTPCLYCCEWLFHFLLCKALWITTVYEMCYINNLALPCLALHIFHVVTPDEPTMACIYLNITISASCTPWDWWAGRRCECGYFILTVLLHVSVLVAPRARRWTDYHCPLHCLTASRLHGNKRSGNTDQPGANDQAICLLLHSDIHIFLNRDGGSQQSLAGESCQSCSWGLEAWWGGEQLSLWIIRPGF